MPSFDEKRNEWICKICGLAYQNEAYAYSCEKSHEMIMVEFRQEDLARLIQYMFNPDPRLLTKSLWDTVAPYKSMMKGLAPRRKK